MDARFRIFIFVCVAAIFSSCLFVAFEHRSPARAAASIADGGKPTCNSSNPCLKERNGGSGVGLLASSVKGAGIIADSRHFVGVLGQTFNVPSDTFSNGAGLYGVDESMDPSGGNYGVWGTTTYGAGVVGATYDNTVQSQQGSPGVVGVDQGYGNLNIGVQGIAEGTAMLAVSLGPQEPAGQPQFPALEADCTGGSLAMTADNGYGSPGGDVMSLDCAGNMILKGSIVTEGVPLVRVGAPGRQARAAYAAEQARPAIEDDGEARIVNGTGYVPIDAAFGQAADVVDGYSVFLTPEGPSLGLYVTAKTPSGFAVCENPGGHASIGFAYRIVATPLGTDAPRLPDMASVQTSLYREAAAAPHDANMGNRLMQRFRKPSQR
jgi:hypothetical protein